MVDSFVFIKCGAREAKKILPAVNAVLKDRQFVADETVLMAAHLSFYPDLRLIELLDHKAFPAIKRRALYNDETGKAILIDYQLSTIQALNKNAPLVLNNNTVVDYLRFYFDHVSGAEGKFQLVEAIDDIPWIEEPAPPLRRSMGSIVTDAELKEVDSEGAYILEASLLFKSCIFLSILKVTTAGIVDIQSQDMVMEDLPVHDEGIGH